MKLPWDSKRQSQSWLILVRVTWCVLACLVLGLVIGSVVTASLSVHVAPICNRCNMRVLPPPSEGKVLIEQSLSSFYLLYVRILCVIFALSCFVVAGVLVWRKPDDWMALFAAFVFIFMAVTFCSELPGISAFLYELESHISYLGITGLFLFSCLFPLGRLTTPWWSRLLALAAVLYGGSYFLFTNSALNPFEYFFFFGKALEYGIVAGIAFVQGYRYKHISDPVLRRQTSWVMLGICSAAILYLVQQQLASILPHSRQPLFLFISETMFFIVLLLIPLSIGIAILRSRLWNIDIIIHRTLVYGALSACVVGLYILLVGGAGMILQGQSNVVISLLATGLIAVLFQPLRNRLQQAVSYLVYGARNDPYRVLSLLSQRLDTTLVPGAALSTIVATVAQAFKLPYVAITLKQGEQFVPGAVYGQVKQEDTLLHLALTYQGELLGELILANDAAGEAFSAADRRLLEDLARHAGIAVHAVRLGADIQRSREQLVMTREEERRRLRRDLHDGLGPQLASLMLLLTTVRKMLHRDPDAAEKMLTEAMMYMQEAISDIRRLVYGLRPPALDDLGLLVALQEDIQRYHGSGIVFSLVAPESLPPLPAAVEVACYRIAQEALMNVISHAHAHHCTLHLSIDDALALEIVDDGEGLPEVRKNGIGLASICERAQELGGTCSIERAPEGGTRVYARLPLHQQEPKIDLPGKEIRHGAHSHSDR